MDNFILEISMKKEHTNTTVKTEASCNFVGSESSHSTAAEYVRWHCVSGSAATLATMESVMSKTFGTVVTIAHQRTLSQFSAI